MPSKRRFVQCDVFTPYPTKGNALAVVLDAEGLSEEAMKAFARWTNLAETTFLFPPDTDQADYKVRIFTPNREMPFAGHPTLGSCASWLHAGGMPRQSDMVRQECAVGIVEIDISSDIPAFIAPPTEILTMPAAKFDELTTKLQINPDHVVRHAVLNNGPQWHAFELQSAEQVLAVDSSLVRWPNEKAIGLIGPYKHATANSSSNTQNSAEETGSQEQLTSSSDQIDMKVDFEVRMLAPSSGMSEDPITGSLNSALAHWRLHNGDLESPALVAQGTSINRHGRVYLTPSTSVEGQVSIGGQTHILVEGTVEL